jgi:hypothetical protein
MNISLVLIDMELKSLKVNKFFMLDLEFLISNFIDFTEKQSIFQRISVKSNFITMLL